MSQGTSHNNTTPDGGPSSHDALGNPVNTNPQPVDGLGNPSPDRYRGHTRGPDDRRDPDFGNSGISGPSQNPMI